LFYRKKYTSPLNITCEDGLGFRDLEKILVKNYGIYFLLNYEKNSVVYMHNINSNETPDKYIIIKNQHITSFISDKTFLEGTLVTFIDCEIKVDIFSIFSRIVIRDCIFLKPYKIENKSIKQLSFFYKNTKPDINYNLENLEIEYISPDGEVNVDIDFKKTNKSIPKINYKNISTINIIIK